VLCSMSDKPVSGRQIRAKLADRGVATSQSSLSQIARALEKDGYLQSAEVGHGRQRETVYSATTRGRVAILQARVRLRSLLEMEVAGQTAGA